MMNKKELAKFKKLNDYVQKACPICSVPGWITPITLCEEYNPKRHKWLVLAPKAIEELLQMLEDRK